MVRSLMSVNGGKVHGECPGLDCIPACRQGGRNNRLTKFHTVDLPINCVNCLGYRFCTEAADEQPASAGAVEAVAEATPAAEVVEVEQPAEARSYGQTIATLARQFRQHTEQGTMNLDVRGAIVHAAADAGRAAGIGVEVALTELFEEIEAPAPAGARPVPAVALPAADPIEALPYEQAIAVLADEFRAAARAGAVSPDVRGSFVRRVGAAARRGEIDAVAALTVWCDFAAATAAA